MFSVNLTWFKLQSKHIQIKCSQYTCSTTFARWMNMSILFTCWMPVWIFSTHKWYVFWTILQAEFPSSPTHLQWVWVIIFFFPCQHWVGWSPLPLDPHYTTSYSQWFGLPLRTGVLKKEWLIPMKVSLQVWVSRQDHSNLNLSLLLSKPLA